MKRIFCTAVAVLLLASVLCSIPAAAEGDLGESTVYVGLEGVARYDMAQEMLTLVNAERTKLGLPPVKLDASLSEDALLRAGEVSMYFSHERPIEAPFYSVIEEDYDLAAETFGQGYETPAAMLKAWMENQESHEIITYAPFEYLGVGVFEVSGQIYWVQIFAQGGTYEPLAQAAKQNHTVELAIKRKLLEFSCPRQSVVTCELFAFKPYVLMNGHPLTNDTALTVVIDDESVAALENGLIVPKKAGQTTITLSVGGFCSYTVPLTVLNDYCGDLNSDDKVDSTDARLTLQYAVHKLNDQTLHTASRGDVNLDGKVDSTDARLILQYAVNKVPYFEAGF